MHSHLLFIIPAVEPILVCLFLACACKNESALPYWPIKLKGVLWMMDQK
jgi:hypothetical protein